ncbi:aminotransferase class I/II-fold pyridoxal phosphate-dependent enzyme [Mycolicibacterium fluoranthenivorans]|uniref:8-amino-7-oxononanoate synthase n=1 Tax=Mycolicibacterium fluoranthenivorans TaxID=258505 RepID=A0A7X5TYC0_9MYCO|nr:pyridoxal phosphate-dependent aminotransferase family protein [Mycolicibacterium fluoranthenivorans]MCV7358895.1 pyridoxal phosphate-dependent aminotransferase family protein [Mycolicibacterium fluoranthenivorans]NIH95011.1 8-amino-7-oxononanoate synthase [Mycolicibacterium fluoranthenivorans]
MDHDLQEFAETGDIAKDVGQRIELVRHFASTGQLPFFQQIDSVDTPRVGIRGRQCVLLGSNSYIGLSTHPDVVAAAVEATNEFGTGTTGSRLLNGTYRLHVALEQQIAAWLGHEEALVFTTGYQTNVGTIQALLGDDCLAVVDSLAHASIRDGVRLSRAVEAKFEHNDAESLAATLRSHAGTRYHRILVIVDSLYSMEGSTAPLERIIDACKDAGALLMVDEAHGIGVFGPTGGGLTQRNEVAKDVDILMGSLSKAIGGLGGFITASRDFIDEIRLSARSFWFSTSATPGAMAAAATAIDIIRSDEGSRRRRRLERNSRLMRDLLAPLDVALQRPDDLGPDWSPIIPIRLSDEMRTALSWNQLRDAGVFVTPAIYPAVPMGEPILRVCMTSELSEDDVRRCADVLTAELSWALAAV